MRSVSFYHKDTGAIHPYQLSTSDERVIALNVPVDHAVIAGHHDRLTKRVNVATGMLEDIEQPVRRNDEEWHERRWLKRAT